MKPDRKVMFLILLVGTLCACRRPAPSAASPRPETARAPEPPAAAVTTAAASEPSPKPRRAATAKRIILSSAPTAPIAVDVTPEGGAADCASDLILDLAAPIPDLEIELKSEAYSAIERFTTAEPPVDERGCIRDDGAHMDRRSSAGHVGFASANHTPFTVLLFKRFTRDPVASLRSVPATAPVLDRDVTRWFTFLLAGDLASGEIRGRVLALAPRALFVFATALAATRMVGLSGQGPLVSEPLLIEGDTAFAIDGMTFPIPDRPRFREVEAMLADAPNGPIALPSLGRRRARGVEVNLAGGSNVEDFIAPLALIRDHAETLRGAWVCHHHTFDVSHSDLMRICSPFERARKQLAVKIEAADRKTRKPLLAELTARIRGLFPEAQPP